MNEEHAFARIERRLAREDPELAQRIDAINSQFTDMCGEGTAQADERRTGHCDGRAGDRTAEEGPGDHADGGHQRSRSAVTAAVLAAVAILGLLLTAILSSPGGTQEPIQPNGLAPPAVLDVVEELPSS
ncbi:hypothetical protein ACLGIH_03815 [Streptomyces sp. HMX87]|uniref:hypothetical protein n=1 Tax=Streptomyces sp. HMX87 TaxID=3390849 RepID=UPI003A870434